MKRSTLMKRSSALITLIAFAGIVIIVNALSAQWFGRADMTANHLNSLSPYSVDVLNELGEGDEGGQLLVKLYASRNLPDREKAGPGMERDIRGVDQKLKDILEEYRARSDGRMLIEVVEEDLESKAEEAGLEPFVGEKTELTEGEKGRFEMKQYYLGLTLHYKGVMEVVPKALEPGLYEYELTRAMIRLRDKAVEQRRLKEMFRVADDLEELAEGCHEQVTAYTPKEDDGEQLSGIEGLLKPIENLEQEAEALVKNRALVEEACKDLMPRFQEVKEAWIGKHRRFDAFLTGDTHDEKLKGGMEGLAFAAQKLVEVLAGEAPTPKDVGQWKDIIVNVKGDLSDYHKELKDSAGQQKLGFLCGRQGFCPVPTETPIFSEEALQAASMQNQQFAQILQYQAGMEQQLRQLLLNIRNQLFRRQDFDVVRVEAGEPVSDEIKALVVFGIREQLSAADRYWVDQYLLDGGTVIAFVPRYDVNLGLFSQDSYMKSDRQRRRSPDRYDITTIKGGSADLLAAWGVTVEPALIMDPAHAGKVNLPHVVRRDNMEYQGNKDFEYPLFVHASEMDQESVLVRSLPGIVLPFVSPLSFEKPEGVDLEATALVKTSDQAVAFPHPDRYWLWSTALETQEKAAKAAATAWTAVARKKDGTEDARKESGRTLKRSLRAVAERTVTSADALLGLALFIEEEEGDDVATGAVGVARSLQERCGALDGKVSDAADQDLEAIAKVADDIMGLAGELRMELARMAWKSWTDEMGGDATREDPPKLELVPSAQVDLAANMGGKGVKTLVLLVEGEFSSAFADGEGLPQGLTDEQRAARLVSGPGRLLVVGSDLGLRLPDPEWVFEGIDPANFVPGPEMVRPQLRVDNWQLRIGQVGRSLTMDGIPFLLNSLDWAVQRIALADIRAKQNPLRRIRTLESETSRTIIEFFWIGGLPLLFLLFGVGVWQSRRMRRRKLRARYASGAQEEVASK